MLLGVVFQRFLPYLLGLGILVGGIAYIRHLGYQDGVSDTTQRYELAIQEERDRIEKANQAALEEARKVEEELNSKLIEREALIQELQNEAISDSQAERPALSFDGVLRINRIR